MGDAHLRRQGHPLRGLRLHRDQVTAQPSFAFLLLDCDRSLVLARVDRSGGVLKEPLPEDSALITSVTDPAGRALLFVSYNFQRGTSAWDAATLTPLVRWPIGSWGNAGTLGPSASPDGRYVAVPTPYGGRVDFIRTSDLVDENYVQAPVRDQGPAQVVWGSNALTVVTASLPYE